MPRKRSTSTSYSSQNSSHLVPAERAADLTWFPFSVVTCQAQEDPEHGSLDCTHPLGTFSYNSSCAARCAEGYVPSSPEPTRCTASGAWSAPPPACNGTALRTRGTLQFVSRCLSFSLFLNPIYHSFKILGKVIFVVVFKKTCYLSQYKGQDGACLV